MNINLLLSGNPSVANADVPGQPDSEVTRQSPARQRKEPDRYAPAAPLSKKRKRPAGEADRCTGTFKQARMSTRTPTSVSILPRTMTIKTEALEPQGDASALVARALDQSRTAFYRPGSLYGSPEMEMHHTPLYRPGAENQFPLRDPGDPLNKVYSPFASHKDPSKCDPDIQLRATKLTYAGEATLNAACGMKLPRETLSAIQGSIAKEMNRLMREVKKEAHSCSVRRLTERDLRPGEESLRGHYGLFAPAEADPAKWPTLINGQVLGIYMGAVIPRGKQSDAYVENHPGSEKYQFFVRGIDRGPTVVHALAACNGTGYANTALMSGPDGERIEDHSRMNAVFFEATLNFATPGGPRREKVIVLGGLPNLYTGGEETPEIRVSYGPEYLQNFAAHAQRAEERAERIARHTELKAEVVPVHVPEVEPVSANTSPQRIAPRENSAYAGVSTSADLGPSGLLSGNSFSGLSFATDAAQSRNAGMPMKSPIQELASKNFSKTTRLDWIPVAALTQFKNSMPTAPRSDRTLVSTSATVRAIDRTSFLPLVEASEAMKAIDRNQSSTIGRRSEAFRQGTSPTFPKVVHTNTAETTTITTTTTTPLMLEAAISLPSRSELEAMSPSQLAPFVLDVLRSATADKRGLTVADIAQRLNRMGRDSNIVSVIRAFGDAVREVTAGKSLPKKGRPSPLLRYVLDAGQAQEQTRSRNHQLNERLRREDSVAVKHTKEVSELDFDPSVLSVDLSMRPPNASEYKDMAITDRVAAVGRVLVQAQKKGGRDGGGL